MRCGSQLIWKGAEDEDGYGHTGRGGEDDDQVQLAARYVPRLCGAGDFAGAAAKQEATGGRRRGRGCCRVGDAMRSLSGSPGIPEAARQSQPFGAYGPRGCWRTMLHLNLSIHK
jgi:hypothetical protein